MSYGYPIGNHRWTKLHVRNPEFIQSGPTAAVSIGPNLLLVFGGASTKCFKVDTSAAVDSQLEVETATTQLTTEAHFGAIGINYTSNVGSSYFVIDANRKFLYQLELQSLAWKCKNLRELGIDMSSQ